MLSDFTSLQCIVATCNLNQWAMDFDGNQKRTELSIIKAKSIGAKYIIGPELQLSGYSCEDHFLEVDTYMHCDQSLASILSSDITNDILCDIGMLSSSLSSSSSSSSLGLQYLGPLLTEKYVQWSEYLVRTILDDNVVINIITDTITHANVLFLSHLREVFTLSVAVQFSTPIKGIIISNAYSISMLTLIISIYSLSIYH